MACVKVLDVASYILKRTNAITVMKLQKLVYYSQAWSLVWDEKKLFSEKIQAWANGPVVPTLYAAHRGKFEVSRMPGGDCRKLDESQRETVDSVVKYYGQMSSQQLSELTHLEDPWKNARDSAGLLPAERGSTVISHAAMMEYYSSLQ